MSWLFLEKRKLTIPKTRTGGLLGPSLVCFYQTGEESSEFRGVFLGRNQIVPRLFIVGGRSPAGRLKQRTEVGFRYGPIFKAIGTPPVREDGENGIVSHCSLGIHKFGLKSRPGTLGEDVIALAGKGEILFGDSSFIVGGELQCHLVKPNVDVRMVIESLSFGGDPVDKLDAV